MVKILVVSLLLTLLFEEGFAFLWGLRGRRELTIIALVNLLTNPVVVLAYHTTTDLFGWPPVLVTAVLETGAVVVEWYFLKACSEQLKRPFLFALLANTFSYGLGLVLF